MIPFLFMSIKDKQFCEPGFWGIHVCVLLNLYSVLVIVLPFSCHGHLWQQFYFQILLDFHHSQHTTKSQIFYRWPDGSQQTAAEN